MERFKNMLPDAEKLPSVITVMANGGQSLGSAQILLIVMYHREKKKSNSFKCVFGRVLLLHPPPRSPTPLHPFFPTRTRTTVLPLAHIFWIKDSLPAFPQHCHQGLNHLATYRLCAVSLGSGKMLWHSLINKW